MLFKTNWHRKTNIHRFQNRRRCSWHQCVCYNYKNKFIIITSRWLCRIWTLNLHLPLKMHRVLRSIEVFDPVQLVVFHLLTFGWSIFLIECLALLACITAVWWYFITYHVHLLHYLCLGEVFIKKNIEHFFTYITAVWWTYCFQVNCWRSLHYSYA